MFKLGLLDYWIYKIETETEGMVTPGCYFGRK